MIEKIASLMTEQHYNLLAVIGATATGKTGLAVALAERLTGEIISADSRQVYRGLDLGSGKDLHEYGQVPYHLIDIIDPTDEYNLFQYQQDCYQAIAAVRERKHLPILCGGTALYINAVLNAYDLQEVAVDEQQRQQWQQLSTEQLQLELLSLRPDQHNSTDLTSRARLIRALEIATQSRSSQQAIEHPDIKPLVLAIDWPRDERRKRIVKRLKERLDEGMIDEVKRLHEQGVSWEKLAFFGLEYRFISNHLQGQLSYNDMFQKLASAIAGFAKRQDTWLRKMQREGLDIHWLSGPEDPLSQARKLIGC